MDVQLIAYNNEIEIAKENYIKFSDAYKYLNSYNGIPADRLNDEFGIKN